MNPLEHVKELIEKNISDADVVVGDLTGTMDHLEIKVSSNTFKGQTLIEQHQRIMDILKEDLKDMIHAVKIKTLIKED